MVIGVAAPDRRVDAGGRERREKLFRIADSGEGQHLPALERRNRIRIGFEMGAK